MSSSAPADASSTSSAIVVGVVAAFLGGVAFKAATCAGVLAAGAAPLPILLRFLTAFASDAAVAALLLVVGAAGRRRAGIANSVAFAGVVVGVIGAVDVFFALVYGSPLSWNMVVWAPSARSSMIESGPLALSLAAVFVVVIVARLARRVPERRVMGAAAVVFLVGVAGQLVEGVAGDPGQRSALGLDRHHLRALAPSLKSGRATPSSSAPPLAAVDPETRTRRAPIARLAGPAPRHIIVFVSESTASRFVDATTMPTLTALAADHAVSFDDHVAETPVSIKALFALMCGVPPLPDSALETGALARIDCRSLPEVLTAAGFDAGLFHGGYFAFTDKLAFFNERGFSRLTDGESLPDRDAHWHNGWGTDDRAVVDDALAWLDDGLTAGRKTLSVVVPLVPHYEYFLPDGAATPFGTATLIDRYKNGLHFADDVLARLLDGYRQRGVLDDTLVVVVGDHGEAFDEHPRNRLHGGFLYDENLRAPLVVYSAGLLPAGAQHSRRPSTHADVAPTILDLLGVPQPVRPGDLDSIAGHSLVAEAFEPRSSVHFTSYPETRYAVRSASWKLIETEAPANTELFSRSLDPREQRSLGGDDALAGVTDALRHFAVTTIAQRTAALTSAPSLGASYLERVARSSSLPLAATRVFNMVRPCLPITASASEPTTITLHDIAPPARLVGIGVTDASRQRRQGGLSATITGDDGVDHAVVVTDVFEASSRVTTVAPSTTVTVTVAPSPRGAAGCLWLAP